MDVSNILWKMDFNGVAIRGAPTWVYKNQEETISVMQTNNEVADGEGGCWDGLGSGCVYRKKKKERNIYIWKIINGMGFF